MNFCSAKKRTLQGFVMKKEDTTNLCSQKKQTLQSLRGTLYNYVLDTTKLYNTHLQTVYSIKIWAWVWLHMQVRMLIKKSHVSQTVMLLPSSSHNHHLNNSLPLCRPQVTPTTTNHNNWLMTKHNTHTPMSPASKTTSRPMLPAAMSHNPHHKVPQMPKIWRSYQCPTDSCRNPVESGGIKFGRDIS